MLFVCRNNDANFDGNAAFFARCRKALPKTAEGTSPKNAVNLYISCGTGQHNTLHHKWPRKNKYYTET